MIDVISHSVDLSTCMQNRVVQWDSGLVLGFTSKLRLLVIVM